MELFDVLHKWFRENNDSIDMMYIESRNSISAAIEIETPSHLVDISVWDNGLCDVVSLNQETKESGYEHHEVTATILLVLLEELKSKKEFGFHLPK